MTRFGFADAGGSAIFDTEEEAIAAADGKPIHPYPAALSGTELRASLVDEHVFEGYPEPGLAGRSSG